MARRNRIELDEPSSTDVGTDANLGGVNGVDSGDIGNSSGDGGNSANGGGADPAAILGSVGGTSDDGYIRGDDGSILYDVRGRPRKRRAKRGSKGRASAATKKVPVDALASLLMLAHGTLATLTKTPELELNQNESKMLATPLSDLLVLYDIQPPPQAVLAMQMIYACSYVYGPRIAMIGLRRKQEAEEKRAEKAAKVRPAAHSDQPFKQATDDIQVMDFKGFGDINTNYGGLKN